MSVDGAEGLRTTQKQSSMTDTGYPVFTAFAMKMRPVEIRVQSQGQFIAAVQKWSGTGHFRKMKVPKL